MHSRVAAEVHSSQGSYYLETSAKSLPLYETSQQRVTSTSAFQPSQHTGEQSLITDATSSSQNFQAILRKELIESECRMENLIARALREFSMKVGQPPSQSLFSEYG
jgi:hypothetical protein